MKAITEWTARQKSEDYAYLQGAFYHYFDDEEVEGTDYSELFEDHDSVQKAFVLSEIFQKKY